MTAARRSAAFVAGFGAYVRWLTRRAFRGLWVPERVHFPESGFIAIANHTSWWDGFVPFIVQRACSQRHPFYLMMSDEGLQRFPFFRYGGAFSSGGTSLRRAYDAIEYAAERARDGAGVWIFPQGRLEPPGTPLRFTRGFALAAQHARVPVLTFAMRFALLDAQRPDAFVAQGPMLRDTSRATVDRAQLAVQRLLDAMDGEIASGRAMLGRRALLTAPLGIDAVSERIVRALQRRS